MGMRLSGHRQGRRGRLRLGAAVLGASSLAHAGAAIAQAPALKQCFKAEFFVEPINAPSEAVWIPEGDPIFETRLLPRELWKVSEPVMLAGAEVLSPGHQLMTMRSAVPMRCNFPLMGANAPGPRERVCVFDQDRDGQFESIDVRGRGGEGWFARVWEHPVGPLPKIAPVAMTAISPAEFIGGPKLKYYSDHTPLRRKPRDGSPPYYEAFTRAKISVPNGIEWFLELAPRYSYTGLLAGSVIEFEGLWMRVEEVAAEKTKIAYRGNFAGEAIDLPFEVPLAKKCDITAAKMR